MKSITTNYSIISSKLGEDRRIILISDVHDIFTKKKIRKQLITDINDLGAHHVAIAGDTMQGCKYDNSLKCAELSYFLDGLAEAQPILLSLGNHDLIGLTRTGRRNYVALGKHKNIYPLDNTCMVLDNFRITGFSTSREAYAPVNYKNGLANTLYTKEWNESNFHIDSDSNYFEELLGHAPHPVTSKEVQDGAIGIKNFDLYLAGHLHDGYVPGWLKHKLIKTIKDQGIWEMPIEKDINGKITKIRPWIYSSINLCRGIHYINGDGNIYMESEDGNNHNKNFLTTVGTPLIVSGGINKFFGFPSSPEITIIDITPTEKVLLKK